MSWLFAGYIGFILGAIVAVSFRHENDCPQVELGYDCNGEGCDHSKSELYRCMMVMAKHRERYEAQNERQD